MARQLNILHLDMDDNLNFRAATVNDCSDLAILGDSATRCLSSHLWTKIASAGQSSFEIGRTSILSDTEHYIHYKNWRVAELNRTVVGALNTYRISQSTQARKDLPDVLRPLDELKAIAQGTRYISAIAVFLEFRRNKYASQLLTEAERVAKQENDSVLTLKYFCVLYRANPAEIHCCGNKPLSPWVPASELSV